MFKIVLMIAVATTGLIEMLKKVLPTKITESKVALTVVSGIVSTIVSASYVTIAWFLNGSGLPLFSTEILWVNYLIGVGGTVGLVQVSYNVLLQTFKAIKSKLTAKTVESSIDPDKVSDEVIEKLSEGILGLTKEMTKKK